MGYEQSKSMAMRDIYIDSDRIYFSNHTFNALISMDKVSGEFKYVKSFIELVPWMKGIHRRVIRYKDSLFFFPDDSQGISKYNIITGEMKLFKSVEEFMQLADAISFGKDAYLIPRSIKQPLYVFDMEKCSFQNKNSWNSIIIEKLNISSDFFIWPPCIVDRTIWVLLKDLNVLVATCIDDWSLEIYYFDKALLFDSITSDGKNIWLSSGTKDVIICWNENDGVLKRYVLSKFRNNNKQAGDISRLVFAQDTIFVLPKMENELFIINSSGAVDKITIPYLQRVHDSVRKLCPLFSGCIAYAGEVFLLPWAADKMYKFNLDTYKIAEFDMTFPDAETYYKNIVLASEIWREKDPIMESMEQYHEGKHQNINLVDYLYIIANDIQNNERNKQRKERCGYNILNLIMRVSD